MSGSHGKKLYFKVTTIQITNSQTGVKRYENINYEEYLGKIPSHGVGPANKTQADAEAVAASEVQLGANETITDVTWNHYTQ